MGVWKWRKKYPYSKLKFEQLLDGYNWELKLRDRKGRAKYCSGYQSFPRKFNDLIKELNILFGSPDKFFKGFFNNCYTRICKCNYQMVNNLRFKLR